MRDVRHFLAERRRRRRLAVRVREHRRIGELVRERAEVLDDAIERGQHDLVARPLQHERVTQVVDVFRSAREVDELRDAGDFLVAGEPLLQKVLDRLDVVVGARLDRLDRRAVGFGETPDDLVELFQRVRRKLHLGDRSLRGERFQPLDFDQHAEADQRVLAEKRAQRRYFGCVAAVERRERGQLRVSHGRFPQGIVFNINNRYIN